MIRFSLLLVLFLFTATAKAQTQTKDTSAPTTEIVSTTAEKESGFDLNKAQFRGDVGIAVTNLSGSIEGADFDSDINVYLGLAGRYPLTDHFGVFSGIYYVGRGATVETSDLTFFENISFEFRYVEVPIMISYLPVDRLQLNIGPTISVLTSSEVSFSSFGGLAQGSNDVEDIRGLDFGLNIDLNYLVPLGRERWALNLRYGKGLLDVTTNDDLTVKNQWLHLGASYMPSF